MKGGGRELVTKVQRSHDDDGGSEDDADDSDDGDDY